MVRVASVINYCGMWRHTGLCTPSRKEHRIHSFSLQFSTPAVWDYIYKFPVTILTYDVRSLDGKNHTVRLYYDNTAEVCLYLHLQYMCMYIVYKCDYVKICTRIFLCEYICVMVTHRKARQCNNTTKLALNIQKD